MKKKTLLITACLLLVTVMFVFAAGGDSADPLASLSHLNGAFTGVAEARVEEKLNASDEALLAGLASGEAPPAANIATSWAEMRLKEGDTLLGSTGTGVLLLAGSARVTFSSGTVVDVSAGSAVASGAPLLAKHRYLVAEDTDASFTVDSKTAVMHYQGPYAFSLSGETDYNAIAAALKTMHLFKGSFTGYGQGFDLELAPTRIQALIMFIRVLGEESAALGYTGTTPFQDVAKGTQTEKYVGYAVSQGYTNGYTPTLFKPQQSITVNQYMEFMLRALGYSSTANTDLSATLDTAMASGVLTLGEYEMLERDPFLRAELVYVSYYALDASMAVSGRSLEDTLIEKAVFTAQESSAARALISTPRK